MTQPVGPRGGSGICVAGGDLMGGRAGRLPIDVNKWIISAQGYDYQPKPWMVTFANKWLGYVNSGERLTPQMTDYARSWLSDTLSGKGFDPKLALPAIGIVDDCFKTQAENIEGFGRCMIRLAEFSLVLGKEAPGQRVDDYIAPLSIFSDPRLLESGLRLAAILCIKTAGHKLATRCLLTDLPIELFNNDPGLFESAVQRLAQTETVMDGFTKSFLALKKIYASRPEKFNEGLDVIDDLCVELERIGAGSLIDHIALYVLPVLVDAYAGYTCKILEKADVDSECITTEVPTKVRVSANQPEWFAVQIDQLKQKLFALHAKGVGLYEYVELYDRLAKWIGRQLGYPASLVIETAGEIHKALLNGEIDGVKTGSNIEKMLYPIVHLKLLEADRAKNPQKHPEEEYQELRKMFLGDLSR